MQRTSGRAASQAIIGSIGHKFGICSGRGKRLHSCGQFGTKPLWSMNGGRALRQPQSLSNVFFAFLTRVNQSNIDYGIAFKLGELGDGPHSLCMNSVGLESGTMTASTGSKSCSGKGFPKNMARRFKFGIFLGALHSRPSGLNVMTKFSTVNNGMCLRSNTGFGTSSSSTAKLLGTAWWRLSKLVIFRWRPCSKVLTILGERGMFFVGDIIYVLSGIGKGNVGRRTSLCLWLGFVVWGLSSAGGVGVVLVFGGSGGLSLVGVNFCYSLHGGVLHPRGPASPQCGCVFFLVLINSGVGYVGLLCQIKK